MTVFTYAVLASLLAGLGTGIGALPVLFFRNISRNVLNTLLGAAAGVMLAATAFSLIVPGIESGDLFWPGYGVFVVMAGIMAGAVSLDLIDKYLPHEHFFKGPEGPASDMKRIWLFVIAIAIHNFPEGLAVGVGVGGGDMAAGITLAIGIGLQNMPEGLAVALPLIGLGYSRWKAVGIATLTGLVEPVGGVLGAGAVALFQPILPFALAYAAGAMLFVISDEIIPETHSRGRSRQATYGLMIGFILMMGLDYLFG
jgi:zinc transporter, ZIP family